MPGLTGLEVAEELADRLGDAVPAVVFVTAYDDYALKAFDAAAVDYLRVIGHLVLGYFWARMAQASLKAIAAGSQDPFYASKLQTARFYFARLFPETATLLVRLRAGSASLMDTEAALA